MNLSVRSNPRELTLPTYWDWDHPNTHVFGFSCPGSAGFLPAVFRINTCVKLKRETSPFFPGSRTSTPCGAI